MVTINITRKFIWNNADEEKKKKGKKTRHIKDKTVIPNNYYESDEGVD